MSDLVQRLRKEAFATSYKPTKPWDLLVEAADEIERLRKDAESFRLALAAYERGLIMGEDRDGPGYISVFLRSIQERATHSAMQSAKE